MGHLHDIELASGHRLSAEPPPPLMAIFQTCLRCNGSGREPCHACGGSGRARGGACFNCNGHGGFRCSSCNGEGGHHS